MDNQEVMPILDMLEGYRGVNPLRLHMPGHKGNYGLVGLSAAAEYDITELSFSDNLASPNGVIKEAEQLFAELFGARHAAFSVNGSSAGIWAMISLCDSIMVWGGCHRSAFDAVRCLNKSAYVFHTDYIDGRYELPEAYALVDEAVKANVDAVMVVSPDYYGRTLNLKALYDGLHTAGIKLLVDSAHGAHFGLSDVLPEHAVKYCDMCVVSTHKTLSAFTQTAVLMANDDGLFQSGRNALRQFLSTSPSYVLMATIDYARKSAYDNRRVYVEMKSVYDRFCDSLCVEGLSVERNADFTRLVINCDDAAGLTDYLEKQNVYCEFYDCKRVVFIFTANDGITAYGRLNKALNGFVCDRAVETVGSFRFKNRVTRCNQAMGGEYVDIELALGRIAAQDVGLMPPCVPLIHLGECIDFERINILKSLVTDSRSFGLCNGKIRVI